MVVLLSAAARKARTPSDVQGAREVSSRLRQMQVVLSDERLEVRLALWEKILGLLGNISVQRADIAHVRVVADPVREAMTAGIKVGLRLPWLCYVARTLKLDQAFLVRRGVPAVSFEIRDGRTLARVLVSTRDADALARALSGPASNAAAFPRAARSQTS